MRGQKVFTVTEESAVEGMHDIDVHVYENREDALKYWKYVVGLWKEGMDDWQQAKKKEAKRGRKVEHSEPLEEGRL